MFGAIIGDLAGSIYEYEQLKRIKPIITNNIIEESSFYSDDTILSMAILDAILSKTSYESKLKEWANKYINYSPNFYPYFHNTFSKGFINWVNSNEVGCSKGNGAMMRVSPVGYLFNKKEEIIENARLATIPSHDDEDSIKCATIIALIIFYARNGYSKQEIIQELNIEIKKPNITKFNLTCNDTIDVCLYSLFNSSSFEEAIKLTLLFGGDTDTNACIVGSMAEAMYGIDESLKNQAIKKLPKEMINLLNKAYSKINISDNKKRK